MKSATLRTSLGRAFFVAFGLLLAGCGRNFVAQTPQGFVDLGDKYPSGEYRATTADGVVLGVREFENDPKGPLDFWVRTLERQMREVGGYALLDRKDCTSKNAVKGVTLRFGHDEGKEPFIYELSLFVTDKRIFLVEAGGSKTEMQKQAPRVDFFLKNFAPK